MVNTIPMRKIFLTSTGLTDPELADDFLRLIAPLKPADAKIGYVTTASDPEPDKAYVLRERAALDSLGFKDIVDIDLKVPEDLAKLDDRDIIYVDGGNTYYLLKWIRQSGFDQKLKELLANDKCYVGVSAGSIVMGTSIEVAAATSHGDRNEIGLEDIRGLRQAPFMISPHFTHGEKLQLDLFARKAALRPLVAITDQQAIICEGDRYRAVGPDKVMTWNSKLFR